MKLEKRNHFFQIFNSNGILILYKGLEIYFFNKRSLSLVNNKLGIKYFLINLILFDSIFILKA